MPTEPVPHDLDAHAWRAILEGRHATPGAFLGPRIVARDAARGTLTRHVRTFQPAASRAWLVHQAHGRVLRSVPMRRTHRAGIFEAFLE